MVAKNGGTLDAVAIALVDSNTAACENFRKEADATNVGLKTATNRTYRHGAVHQLTKFTVEFDTNGKHSKLSG